MRLECAAIASLRGTIRPPSDKSLTHRAYLLAACATSPSVVEMPLAGEDCQATLRCICAMGAQSQLLEGVLSIRPAMQWLTPAGPLDCGNSGTTMRLLCGLIASRPIRATLSGDPSLSKRPMRRVVDPLRLMGAHIEGDRPPVSIKGSELSGIDYVSPVASAQVKSCVLLAGLRAQGETWVTEPSLSRDHTERMLKALGVDVHSEPSGNGVRVGVSGGSSWQGFRFKVPADISSAAFWLVAGALVPGSEITMLDVGVNPTRTGVLDVLTQCGTRWEMVDQHDEMGEPVATLRVWHGGRMAPFTIEGALVPRLIDEIPVLAVLATQCAGKTVIRNARELRVKESDRIEKTVEGLRAMGASIEARDDGMVISGPTPLNGTTIDASGDHRIAMAFCIASLIAEGPTVIEGAESIATSYPDFERHMGELAVV